MATRKRHSTEQPQTPEESRLLLASQVSEEDFQATVIRYATLHGWMVYHTWSSQHSASGFPDLVLVSEGRLIFAELKREGKHPTPAQHRWIQELAWVHGRAGDVVACYVWHPSDMPDIERILSALR